MKDNFDFGIILAEVPRSPEMSPPKSPQKRSKKTDYFVAIGLVLILLIIVPLVVSLLSSRPTYTPPSSSSPTSPPASTPTEVSYVDYFQISQEGDTLKVQFALLSQEAKSLSSAGTVVLVIEDEATNDTLYETQFAVTKRDFKRYTTLFGKELLGYVWTIPCSLVEKAFSNGIATLTFTSTDGKSFSNTDDYITIPTYTEEEALQMLEAEYVTSATTINRVLVTDDFEIVVERMGMFSRYVYGDFERMFRVDLKVKNIGGGTKRFSIYDTVIVIKTGLQFERSYYSTFESGDISAGVTKQGYLLFDGVVEPSSISKLVIDEIYIFDFEKDDAYTLMDFYENMYLENAITIDQSIERGNFKITLERVGHFTHLEYDTHGDEVIEFRLDLIVTSIAYEPEYIFESDIVILDNLGNQYDREYGGTLDLGEIFPGVTRRGYVLYPALDEYVSSIEVIITDDDYPIDWVYTFYIDLL